MPETKNIFLGGKMNKDIDPRLLPNREYIEARNASVTDSSGGDAGLVETINGNILFADFGLTDSGLKVNGFFQDSQNDRLFVCLTNYTDSSYNALGNFAPSASAHYIAMFDVRTNIGTVLVGGSFLNFSDTHRVLGMDLIENILFITDNRNQPRKINVDLAVANPFGSNDPYYTSEDHISVSKYFPCTPPALTSLTGDGDLFVGSSLEIQTNTTMVGGAGSSGTIEVGLNSVTTSGSGANGMRFTITQASDGTGNFILASATVLTSANNYASGDTISVPAAALNLALSGTANGAISLILRRENMNRITSMWDVTSALLPDGNTTNPYVDATFDGDTEFMSDKFIRFSYRYKFEDNEYSLIAPFSQAAFKPKQDGYFMEDTIPTSILDDTADSDENNAIKSTIVEFFENKVNRVDINIPAPLDSEYGAGDDGIYKKYKIVAIDVLYKESDDTNIRVIDTISYDDIINGSGDDYIFEYNSTAPIRALPTKEIVRVSDIVPLRAKAQAVAGNRVIYGNLLLKSASLDSLNYTVTADEKVAFGVGGATSQQEYPNHTLKQNRSYQVGVVLSDKFGRQSDVILAPASTIFHPYKSALMDLDYLGDSLQIEFNAPIPTTSSNRGYIGLYDATTNPLGWYSYKFVVKQQEQSYYNVYLPTILNNYPQAVTGVGSYTTVENESHITLFSDNINKVPRDLQDVGPQDQQFASSAKLFGRIHNTSFSSTAPTNEQYFPTSVPDVVILIGDRDELGLNKITDGSAGNPAAEYYSSPFYSIPTQDAGGVLGDGADLVGANPYIGRVSTIDLIGAVGGGDLSATTVPSVTNLDTRLNVYETAPFNSNLEIFWETSTAGYISELNATVVQNVSTLPTSIINWVWSLNEATGTSTEVARFDIAAANGIAINNSSTSVELVEVKNGQGANVTDLFTVSKDGGTYEFYVDTASNATFIYDQNSPVKDSYSFTFKATYGGDSIISTGYGNFLGNVIPTLTPTGSATFSEISAPSTWVDLADLDGDNGASATADQKKGLIWEVTKAEYQWTGNASAWTEYTTDLADMFRIVKGSGQSIPETLQYSNNLTCLNINSTVANKVYDYTQRTTTSVRITLKLTDANGYGMSDTAQHTITLNRTD